MELRELIEECKYMPTEFRDFHDQKDLFKLIFSRIKTPDQLDHISWVDAHIFTVDVFLYFMAKRGYTLQRSRHKIDFIDITEEIIQENTKRANDFSEMLLKNAQGNNQ